MRLFLHLPGAAGPEPSRHCRARIASAAAEKKGGWPGAPSNQQRLLAEKQPPPSCQLRCRQPGPLPGARCCARTGAPHMAQKRCRAASAQQACPAAASSGVWRLGGAAACSWPAAHSQQLSSHAGWVAAPAAHPSTAAGLPASRCSPAGLQRAVSAAAAVPGPRPSQQSASAPAARAARVCVCGASAPASTAARPPSARPPCCTPSAPRPAVSAAAGRAARRRCPPRTCCAPPRCA